MAVALLLGLTAFPAEAPPPWPPAVHMSGMLDGTSSIMGITIGPISGPFEMWASCDIHQPQQAKMKMTGATTAYGVTVLNNTVLTYCSPSATTAGTLYESVA